MLFDFSWSFMNRIIKSFKMKNTLEVKDFDPDFIGMRAKQMGQMFAQEYNKNPNKGLFKIFSKIFRGHIVAVAISLPIFCAGYMCAPICINYFSAYLQLHNFYKCDTVDSNGVYNVVEKSSTENLKYQFSNLYGWLLLILIGNSIKICAESSCALHCVQFSLKITASLLDALYNKISVLSETTKQINAQGSVSNILFSDTYKIQIFLQLSYWMIECITDVIVGTIFIGIFVKPIAMVASGCVIIMMPIVQIFMDDMQKQILRLSPIRDDRSEKIIEVLNAIKIVKLFNQEDFHEKKIENIRLKEKRHTMRINVAIIIAMMFGFVGYAIMMVIALGALLGLNQLDLTQSFTLQYILSYLQGSISFLPQLFSFLQDARVALKRIHAFLKLPQIDRSFIKIDESAPKAIEVTGGHSYSYGLQEDYQVCPELDSEYYIKQQQLKAIKKLDYRPQIKQLVAGLKADQLDCLDIDIIKQVQNNVYDIKNDICNLALMKLQFPSSTYYMNILNYSKKTFQLNGKDSSSIQLMKLYIHQSLVQYYRENYEKDSQNQVINTVIKNFNLSIEKGQLIGIKGPVGSGKSSLFACMLGEMKTTESAQKDKFNNLVFDYYTEEQQRKIYPEQKDEDVFITLGGKICYCPQNSPIFSMTIRENICFYKPYEEQKYNRIVDLCCLLPDFEIFKAGDNTEVGGRGVTLSGGQRARISLARAVYNDADIYLLDDVLSAVDVHVGQRIWQEVIVGYLIGQGKTVVIASHQAHYFVDCDRILTIEDGQIVKDVQGRSHRGSSYESSSRNIGSTTSYGQLTQQVKQGDQDEGKLTSDEETEEGGVSMKVYVNYFKVGNKCMCITALIFILLFCLSVQYLSILLTNWTNDEYKWTQEETQATNSEMINNILNKYSSDILKQQVALTCYYNNNPNATQKAYSIRYYYLMLGVVGLLIILFIIYSLSLFMYTVSAGQNLFKRTFHSLIRTPLAFFDTTPQGRIINRTVRDIEALELILPRFMFVMITLLMQLILMILVICVLSWPCIFVILPCVIVNMTLYVKFRKLIPSIRRLEGVLRSKVYNCCQETLDQLTSLRAYGATDSFRETFRRHCDENIVVQWAGVAMGRQIQFKVGIIGGVMSFLIAVASIVAASFSPSIAQYSGILVSYSFTIQMFFIFVIQTWNYVDGEFPGFERVAEYMKLPSEVDIYNDFLKNLKVDAAKENKGLLITDLKLRYRPELPLALKGVNLHVEPHTHVAVVGRTGSGKSTLASSYFNLYQAEGNYNIQVDDVQLSTLPLYERRRSIAIIPQEPFLFSGTLRQQLCEYTRNKAEGLPYEHLERIPDERLWSMLEQVSLAAYIRTQPGQLDCQVIGNGDNFSAGQRQLVCVIRALLLDVQVVLLDEATAYVDLETDKIIQDIVKHQLKDKIVISVAHRIDTVLSMENVLVMDQGLAAEYGSKYELYQKPDGIFRALCDKAGVEVLEE